METGRNDKKNTYHIFTFIFFSQMKTKMGMSKMKMDEQIRTKI
jgi:hypothetical protein